MAIFLQGKGSFGQEITNRQMNWNNFGIVQVFQLLQAIAKKKKVTDQEARQLLVIHQDIPRKPRIHTLFL
jgi:hypothetical protein